jgi:hypothetical protein
MCYMPCLSRSSWFHHPNKYCVATLTFRNHSKILRMLAFSALNWPSTIQLFIQNRLFLLVPSQTRPIIQIIPQQLLLPSLKPCFFFFSTYVLFSLQGRSFRFLLPLFLIYLFYSDSLKERKKITYCFFVSGATAQRGPGPPYSWGFYITSSDTPQSLELLWTRDRPVAEISTWQHATLKIDRHPWPPRDSNPQYQQAIGP